MVLFLKGSVDLKILCYVVEDEDGFHSIFPHLNRRKGFVVIFLYVLYTFLLKVLKSRPLFPVTKSVSYFPSGSSWGRMTEVFWRSDVTSLPFGSISSPLPRLLHPLVVPVSSTLPYVSLLGPTDVSKGDTRVVSCLVVYVHSFDGFLPRSFF